MLQILSSCSSNILYLGHISNVRMHSISEWKEYAFSSANFDRGIYLFSVDDYNACLFFSFFILI